MAFSLSYDPSQDPDIQENIQQEEANALAVGEELEQQQNELLAGKFQSAADLEAAYLELQSAFSRDRQQQPSEEYDQDDDQVELPELAESLRSEFEEFGQLTQETAAQLGEELTEQVEQFLQSDYEEPTGIPLTAEETAQIQGIVGGPESYQQMVDWSAENLSEAEQDAYNQVMDSGNINAIYWAVKGLQSQFTDAVGSEGRLIRGRAPSSRGESFRSMAELVRAQSDPRYDNDPAYRNDILQKLERSGDLL